MDAAIATLIFLFSLVIGLGLTVLWLVIGWRVMTALERISDTVSEALTARPGFSQPHPAPRQTPEPDPTVVRRDVLNNLVQNGE